MVRLLGTVLVLRLLEKEMVRVWGMELDYLLRMGKVRLLMALKVLGLLKNKLFTKIEFVRVCTCK